MKRKYIERKGWRRVLDRQSKIIQVTNSKVNGIASIIKIKKVNEALIKNVNGKDLILADTNYVWTTYLPKGSSWALTTMYNENLEVVQWYFDVIDASGKTEEGEIYFDDLYLDVVILPKGEVILLDEDELKDALNCNDINEIQYNKAYRTSYEIMNSFGANNQLLRNLSNNIFNYCTK